MQYLKSHGVRLVSKKEWHQPNLRADWIEQKIQGLVTSIRLPAAWRERILAYLFHDESLRQPATPLRQWISAKRTTRC